MAVEYLASNEFTANGVQTDWVVSFKGNRPDAVSGTTPYLNATDVKAQEITPATSTTAEVVVDKTCVAIAPNTFRVTPAPANGHIIRIYRATQDEYNLVDYKSRQTVTEADLDLSNRQNIFIVQETSDQATRAVQDANSAVTLAYEAISRAIEANDKAESAIATANTAQSTATNSVAAANAAQAAADAATAAAEEATAATADAITAANNAVSIANAQAAQVAAANAKADSAISTANAAQSTANGIASTAAAALAAAQYAQDAAADAVTTANAISSTANEALVQAGAAVTTANAAQSTANGVDAKATTALADSATALSTANSTSSSLAALTTTGVPEGTRLYYTDARVRAAPLTGFTTGTDTAIVAADTLLAAMQKAQTQITARARTTEVQALTGTNGRQRNVLDNASFFISQRRATAIYSAAANTYFLDRWKSGSAGTTATTTVNAAPAGDRYLNITAGTVLQVVELDNLFGGTYTFSQAGTSTVTIRRNGVTVATCVGASSVTFTLDVVGMISLTVSSGTGTLYKPQLELSGVATPFVTRSVSDELLQCQRYFARRTGLGMNCPYAGSAGSAMSYRFPWPVTMKAVPTIIVIGPNVSTFQVNSWTADGASRDGFRLIMFSSTAGVFSIDFPLDANIENNFIQGSCEP